MISGSTGRPLSATARGQLQGALGGVDSFFFVGTRTTVLLLNGLSHLEDSILKCNS